MKKPILAIFSISLTAGTICLTYSYMKATAIKKLVKTWTDEAKKKEKTINDKYLAEELDRLNLFDIKRLDRFYGLVFNGAPKSQTDPLLEIIRKKKITEKANLRGLEVLAS